MKLEYTPALLLALRRASHRARQAERETVTSSDLLAGLLVETEGLAEQALSRAGLEPARARQLLGIEIETAGDEDLLRLDDAALGVLRRARDLAMLHSDEGTITTEQVLFALLADDEALRRRLGAEGLDFARLQDAVAKEAEPIYFNEPLFGNEPTETIDLARILDASANRAREGLRVLEDYTRFVLNDATLSAETKQLRHELTAALLLLPAETLATARDTLHDVGTALSTPQEWERPTLAAVLAANARRLQEALRSLEEYGKILGGEFAPRIEALRYRTYTLERALLLGGRSRERLAEARLYVLVTDSLCRASLEGTVTEALGGGAQVIQLREKGVGDRIVLERARAVRRITRTHGALFIMNDRPDLAVLAEADGVHLGQDDFPIHEARRLLGPDALIGVSTHTPEQLHQALLEGASYVGIGPTFPSRTKEFAELAGLDFVRAASAATSLPAFALGGITLDNIAQVLAAGARRVAVSHAVCAAADPRRAAAQLREALEQNDGGAAANTK